MMQKVAAARIKLQQKEIRRNKGKESSTQGETKKSK